MTLRMLMLSRPLSAIVPYLIRNTSSVAALLCSFSYQSNRQNMAAACAQYSKTKKGAHAKLLTLQTYTKFFPIRSCFIRGLYAEGQNT